MSGVERCFICGRALTKEEVYGLGDCHAGLELSL